MLFIASMGLVAACSGEPQLVSTLDDASQSDAGTDTSPGDTSSDTSDDDTGEDSGPTDECIQTTPQQAADFATAYATAICERAFECGTNPDVVTFMTFGGWETVDDCVTMTLAGGITPGQAEQAATEGSLALDSCNSQPCLDGISDIECLAVHRAFPRFRLDHPVSECPAAFRGQVDSGEDCTATAQCAGESVCGRSDSNTDCTGTCQDAGQAGSQCGDIVCDYDQYCETENDICVTKNSAGENCTQNFECPINSRCEGGTCSQGVSGLDVGDQCDFRTKLCSPGLGCLEGTCQELVEPGQTCPLFGCAGDNFCSASTETCEAFKTEGESCSQSQECLSLNCAGGQCAPYDSLCP
ncbi:MAG: hypothetical protein ACQEVA_08775 [Myxococcota bacterium]